MHAPATPTQAVQRRLPAPRPGVVTAAALIMISVFVAFVPGGRRTIKPIAFGLAVGVFVDAFMVRMTFVPAVLVLLGQRAWWLPGWLDARCPSSTSRAPHCTARSPSTTGRRRTARPCCWPEDLVLSRADPPVQSRSPGRGQLVVVPDEATRARSGSVLAGPPAAAARRARRRRAAAARAARVRGHPHGTDGARRRGPVGRLGRRTGSQERARLRDLVRAAAGASCAAGPWRLVDELRGRAPQGADGGDRARRWSTRPSAWPTAVDVFVLAGLEGLTEPDRDARRALAERAGRPGRHRDGGRPRVRDPLDTRRSPPGGGPVSRERRVLSEDPA